MRRRILTVALALLALWCGWVSGFQVGTRGGQVTWVVSFVLVVLAVAAIGPARSALRRSARQPEEGGWLRPSPHRLPATLPGLLPWLSLFAVVMVWEILGLQTGSHQPHLTISALTLALRPVRAVMLAVWMSLGLYFGLVRSRVEPAPPPPPVVTGATTLHAATLPGVALLAASPRVRAAAPLTVLTGGSRVVGVLFWLVVLATGSVIELAARRSTGRIPSLGQLLAVMSRRVPARVLLVLAWSFAGWHLFAH